MGRGPLAGPVVAAAVWLPERIELRLLELGLNDSKKLSAERREMLAAIIRSDALSGVGLIDAARIDEINILKASLEAMGMAVDELDGAMEHLSPNLLLIDGNQTISPHPLPNVRQHAMVRGDQRAVCIAAASVVAKVCRDEIMVGYDELYPGYGFARHKGYPSAEHTRALARLGPCPIHRRSYQGVDPKRSFLREKSS